MAVHVTAPVTGTAVGLVDVPDPVFSASMVGPGAAIDPDRTPGNVVAPVAGTLVKLKPHALVVVTDDGRGVLVHLGINTVRLAGKGFTLLAAEGDRVEVSQPLVHWHPGDVETAGFSPVCPVVALDAATDAVNGVVTGPIDAGARLFVWN